MECRLKYICEYSSSRGNSRWKASGGNSSATLPTNSRLCLRKLCHSVSFCVEGEGGSEGGEGRVGEEVGEEGVRDEEKWVEEERKETVYVLIFTFICHRTNFKTFVVCSTTCVCVELTHIVINGVIVNLSQLINVEVELDLAQNTLHHGHQNVLVPAKWWFERILW